MNYTTNVLPNQSLPYIVNYYDNYDYDKGGITIPIANYYGNTLTTNTKGLLTGTKVRVLNTATDFCKPYHNGL